MSFQNDLEHERQKVRLLSRIIIGLIILCLMIYSFSMNAARDITVHYPPDLRSGTKMKAGQVPAYEAYAFALYISQQLNNWEKDGAKDFPAKVDALGFYLTPRYQQDLRAEIITRLSQGELQNRVRNFRILPGAAYSEKNVEVLGGAWIIWLDVAIEESVSGQKVKIRRLRYPIRVVPYDTNREMNPWQLALDGNGSRAAIDLDLQEQFKNASKQES